MLYVGPSFSQASEEGLAHCTEKEVRLREGENLF